MKFIVWIPVAMTVNYLFYRMTSAFVSIRGGRLLKPVVMLCLFPISNVIIYNNDIVNITWAFGGFVITLCMFYQGSLLEKLSAAFILYPFVASFNYLIGYLVIPIHLLYKNKTGYALTVQKLFIALFWYIMYLLFYKRIQAVRQYLTKKMWILLDIISLTPLISTAYIIITVTNRLQPSSVPVILVSILTGIGILYLFTYMAEHAKILRERENMQLQQEYYKEMERSQQEFAKLRHDINHHFLMISTYLEENKIEEAKKYFKDLSLIVKGNSHAFCRNGLLNAVLNAKYNQAQEREIDTFFHIDIKDGVPMSDLDICSFFSNALDNALEACTKIKDAASRKLTVKARCEKGFFSVMISNSYSQEPELFNGKYSTSKEDKNLHGYGLIKIKDIVKKYGGTIEIKHEKGMFYITAIIAM